MDRNIMRRGIQIDDRRPKDNDRWRFAWALGDIALWFLLAHEFRHVQAGNVEYGASLFGCPWIINEIAGTSTGPYLMECQAMEMDADLSATYIVLSRYLRGVGKASELPPAWNLVLKDQETALFNIVFAITVLFRLFGDDASPPSDWPKGRHPPMGVRLILVHRAVVKSLDDLGYRELLDKVDVIARKATDAVESGIELISGQRMTVEGIVATRGPEGVNHIVEMANAWARIKPELEKYAYHPLRQYMANITADT
jgi:hypothetical protein